MTRPDLRALADAKKHGAGGIIIVNLFAFSTRSPFAKIEDIDVAIRPLLADEGFSFSLDSKAGPHGTEYVCTLSHRDGHSETKTLVLPIDSHSSRSAAQNAGSTLSYARRYLLTMHLNLVTRDTDNDGAGDPQCITPEQVTQLPAPAPEPPAQAPLWDDDDWDQD